MVAVDYYSYNACAASYSTTASSYTGPTNTTTTTSCTCSRCWQSLTYSTTTYAQTNNNDVDDEEKIEIEKPKWPRLDFKIKPNIEILDNRPLVKHRRMLFSKSGWLLSKGKLKRRGY